jgi:hypothetical protein
MALAWVTGVSGSGKSSVCEVLKLQGRVAVDGDGDGFSRWVNRQTAEPVLDPPYPAPSGWLDGFAWRVRPEAVGSLAAGLGGSTGYLCGGFENEGEVSHLFDRVICLFIDEDTLRDRLANRTTNPFGKQPEQLRASLEWRLSVEKRHRVGGATMIDATQPLDLVVAQVVTAAEE